MKRNESDDSMSIFYALMDRRSFELSYCLLGDVVGFVQTYVEGGISPIDSVFRLS